RGSLPVRLATIKAAEACFVAQKSKNNSAVARSKSALLEVIDALKIESRGASFSSSSFSSSSISSWLSILQPLKLKVEEHHFHHHHLHHHQYHRGYQYSSP
ncbi:unnamed protein product, partial [Rotaria magnacalcarata]